MAQGHKYEEMKYLFPFTLYIIISNIKNVIFNVYISVKTINSISSISINLARFYDKNVTALEHMK